MSHACVIVAVSADDPRLGSPHLSPTDESVKEAVSWQMEPFDEGNECFRDGSRWDWWVVGGRFTGKFAPEYDPWDDPDNEETCWLCRGTGKRDDALGAEARKKDPAYTCNGCQGTGRAVKWNSEFKKVGNVCRRKDLDETQLLAAQRKRFAKTWQKWLAEPRKDDFMREFMYGIKEGEDEAAFIARMAAAPLTAYAFLRDRRWCENSRLGWFGASAKTECEIKAEERGEEHQGRCITTCEKTGAKVVTWEEDGDRWGRMFWPRFLRNLAPSTILASIDYHV